MDGPVDGVLAGTWNGLELAWWREISRNMQDTMLCTAQWVIMIGN